MKNLNDKWITGFSDGESSFGVYVYEKGQWNYPIK